MATTTMQIDDDNNTELDALMEDNEDGRVGSSRHTTYNSSPS